MVRMGKTSKAVSKMISGAPLPEPRSLSHIKAGCKSGALLQVTAAPTLLTNARPTILTNLKHAMLTNAWPTLLANARLTMLTTHQG